MAEERDKSSPGTQQSDRPIDRGTLVVLFVWGAALTLLLYFLDELPFVLLMFLAAAAVAAVLRPVSDHLSRRRGLSGTLVGVLFWLLVGGLFALLGWLLKGAIQSQIQRWPQIRGRINEGIQTVMDRLGVEGTLTVNEIVGRGLDWFVGGGQATGMLATVADRVVVAAVALAMIVFGSIYLLSEKRGELTGPFTHLFRRPQRNPLRGALGDLEVRLRWWLLGTLTSMTVVGLFTGVGFWLIGLEFAVALALLAGLAEIVPTFGPLTAFTVAVLVAASQGLAQVLGVAGLYVGVGFLESYVMLPLIMKQAVRIPPVVTLFTIILWARLFGPLGLVLAIPIDVTIWSFLDHFILRHRQPVDKNAPLTADGGET
ncbi:MAG: AI-2E family transporter [Phycisphaeraceae bacterium]